MGHPSGGDGQRETGSNDLFRPERGPVSDGGGTPGSQGLAACFSIVLCLPIFPSFSLQSWFATCRCFSDSPGVVFGVSLFMSVSIWGLYLIHVEMSTSLWTLYTDLDQISNAPSPPASPVTISAAQHQPRPVDSPFMKVISSTASH